MRGKFLVFLLIIFISLSFSNAWWDPSWNKCRNIHISPPEEDFNRGGEIIEIWVSEINQDDCDSIRIVDSSCEDTGNEVKRYISRRTSNGCEIRFQVSRNKKQSKTYSLYYGNPNSGESVLSENYSIFGDNFENGLKGEWIIGENTTEYCGIFKDINSGGNEVFHLNSTEAGECSLNIYRSVKRPSSISFNFSSKKILGNRNRFEAYYINSTNQKNDYFGISNMLNNDVSTSYNPRLEAKAGLDINGPNSNSGDSSYNLEGESYLKLGDPINEDKFHEVVFRYNHSTLTYSLYFDGEYKWSYELNEGNKSWNNGKLYFLNSYWDNNQIHRSQLDVVCVVTDDQECHIYNNPSIVSLGPEQTFSQLEIDLFVPKHSFIDENIQLTAFVSHGNNPLINLTSEQFETSLNDEIITPIDFRNFNNGTYTFLTNLNPEELGPNQLKVSVNSGSQSAEVTKEITILINPESKPVIITNTNWKNYISATSLNIPVLIYNSSRKLIDKFIEDYNPNQIVQLETNLEFNQKNYLLDSRETLVKIFSTNTDLVIPSNRQIALKSSFLNYPVLFEPSQETLQYLNPPKIHNLTSTEQADNLFESTIPNPDYFISTNPLEEESMFSFPLARKKNAFVIFSTYNPQESKNTIIQAINNFHLPRTYHSDISLYLAFISTPHFLVEDPLHNYLDIISDTNYCDINDDGYQDLSCGRLLGSPESLSYQLEYSKIFEEDKTALILASYSTPGKYFDVLSAGGTMLTGAKIEIELLKKGFETKRLVEKRSELEQIDASVLDDLNDLTESLGITEATSYISLFSGIVGDFTKLTLFMRAGSRILYSIYEFDWLNYWRSILNPDRQPPQHLPIFNEENLVNEVKNNQVVAYFSKGNETHWFIPINSTRFTTFYQEFNPSNLDINPLFYYLGHSNSFDIKEKILDIGALSLVSTSSDFYNLYSGETAFEFFKEFDQTVGKAMLMTRNRNYELSQMNLNENRTYEKEYYDTILIGDPSLTFDPNLELKKSINVTEENGEYIVSYSIRPNYNLITFNDSSLIIFKDADDYLFENNKPILPLYKDSFILPTNSEILDFSVQFSGQIYDDIELPIINPDPEYFETQPFTDQFPGELYWNYGIDLLDDRTLFDILISPIIYYSNNSVQVFDEIEITFRYSSPLEITSIDVSNVEQGDSGTITLGISNSLDQTESVDLIMTIETGEFEDEITRQLEIKPDENTFEINYNNTDKLGNYSISALIVGDGIVAGPKYTYFEVQRKPLFASFWYPVSNFFKTTFSGFFIQTKSFKDDYKIRKQGDKSILDYQSLEITIHVEQDNKKTISWINTKKGKLKIEQIPGKLDYQLSTPEGSLHIIKEKGEIKQESNGDMESLKKILNNIVDIYKNTLNELNLTG